MLSSCLAIFALALASGPAQAGFPRPSIDFSATPVPLRLVHVPQDALRYYVEVVDPALGTVLFFLDTGYADTTCDRAFVTALGLPLRETVSRSLGELGSIRLDRADLPDFFLGGNLIHDLHCAVRDLEATSSIPFHPAAPIAGVLGENVLSAFVMEIDPSEGTLLLKGRAQAEAPALPAGARMLHVFPFGKRFLVPLDLDGRTSGFVLDTGSTVTWGDARHLGLQETGRRKTVLRGSGRVNHARTTLEIHAAREGSLAGSTLGRVEVVQRRRIFAPSGLLGMDVLATLALTVDGPGRRLSTRPVTRNAVPDWLVLRERELEAGERAGNKEVYADLASFYLNTRRTAEALRLAREVEAPDVRAALSFALAFEVAERYADALDLLLSALARWPGNPELRHRVMLRLLPSDPTRALTFSDPEGRRAVDPAPEHQALADLARVRLGQDPLSRRPDPLLRALRHPEEPHAWADVIRDGDRDDDRDGQSSGRQTARTLLALDRGVSATRLRRWSRDRTLASLLLGKPAKPEAFLATCAGLEPGHDRIRAALLAVRCGRTADAARWLSQDLPFPTDRAAVAAWYDALSDVETALGDPVLGAKHRQLALQADPSDPYLHARAGLL
jgi:hypothetical protein